MYWMIFFLIVMKVVTKRSLTVSIPFVLFIVDLTTKACFVCMLIPRASKVNTDVDHYCLSKCDKMDAYTLGYYKEVICSDCEMRNCRI